MIAFLPIGASASSIYTPSSLNQLVSIRDFVESLNGTVGWNERTSTATFSLYGTTLTASASGKNNHGLTLTNVDGRLMSREDDLHRYFGISQKTRTVVADSYTAQVSIIYTTTEDSYWGEHFRLRNVSGTVTTYRGFVCTNSTVFVISFGHRPLDSKLMREYYEFDVKGGSFNHNLNDTSSISVDSFVGTIVTFQFENWFVRGGETGEIRIGLYNDRGILASDFAYVNGEALAPAVETWRDVIELYVHYFPAGRGTAGKRGGTNH